MLDYTKNQLTELGASITEAEIYQQPDIWAQTFLNYQENQTKIDSFLESIKAKHDYVSVIFTGAGTSAYVGDTLLPYFRGLYEQRHFHFDSFATTDIVGSPELYLQKDIPTILVSFARSGNSPESVACVELAKKYINHLYQITITCAKDGHLAKQAQGDDANLLLLQPDETNDKGFAMTSSFTSMMLTALLVFDQKQFSEKAHNVKSLIKLSRQVLENDYEIQKLVDLDFDRVIYLGAGPFFGLAHEAQLKILELTAGKIATMYETPIGFRHGPKSLIDDSTLVFVFGSSNPYTKLYDVDLVKEVANDKIARKVIYLSDQKQAIDSIMNVELISEDLNEDIYRVFPYIVYAQIMSLLTSLKVGNRPDTPSPTGTVNRVVQGVIIHEF